jgi:hypothetical protein
MTCEGREKATIRIVFVDGSSIDIVSNHPGVTVSLEPATTSGDAVIHVIGTAYRAGCVIANNYDEIYGETDASHSLSLVSIDNNSCPNGAFYSIPDLSNGNGTVWVKGSAQIVKVGAKNGCKISVSDRTGVIFTKTVNQSCPTYKIFCDEDCPEGQCKCHSDDYPGYCCNDCSATAARIDAITALARSKGNGR